MAATAAISGFGAILARGGTTIGAAYSAVAEVGDITFSGVTVDKHEVTNHDSPSGFAEFIPGIASAGEWTFDLNYNLDTASHETLMADAETVPQTVRYWKLTFPPASGSVGNWIAKGFVTKLSPKVPVKGAMSASVTIQLSGPFTRAG